MRNSASRSRESADKSTPSWLCGMLATGPPSRKFALTASLFALTAKNLALTARVRHLWINRDLDA